MANNLKFIRESQELSPATLAALMCISPFELQKIEQQVTPLRIRDAIKLTELLEISLNELIPGLGTVEIPEKLLKKKYLLSKDLLTLLNENQVDTDPKYHYLKMIFNNGLEQHYDIDGFERARLYSILQQNHSDAPSFFVFNTSISRVIVNLESLSLCQFLYEVQKERKLVRPTNNNVNIYLKCSPEPVSYSVMEDSESISVDSPYILDSQLQNIAQEAESQPDCGDRLCLQDEDGEMVFITWRDVILLEIPLHCIEPNLTLVTDLKRV